ncbi:unnamed protein product [Clonostachys solani]|uniref:Uncharacterized protein n=1 Tax=Clonostachys solani TaxID=160281 RepID=A0A9N9ZGK8_9HYPO|nr:unnamed protein product [Clonostachys solani]
MGEAASLPLFPRMASRQLSHEIVARLALLSYSGPFSETITKGELWHRRDEHPSSLERERSIETRISAITYRPIST